MLTLATSDFITEALRISWSILAFALVMGLIYSVVRIIPRREE
jgi:hypothetical protein